MDNLMNLGLSWSDVAILRALGASGTPVQASVGDLVLRLPGDPQSVSEALHMSARSRMG
jgi:hypothetical protein